MPEGRRAEGERAGRGAPGRRQHPDPGGGGAREEALQEGELGGNQDYGNIFGDPNLFKDFGGFD